jgi:hypothetical protein
VLGTTVPAAAAPPNAAAATVFTTMRPAAAGSPCRIAAVVHFKPEDNRLWQPVIARRRLSVR